MSEENLRRIADAIADHARATSTDEAWVILVVDRDDPCGVAYISSLGRSAATRVVMRAARGLTGEPPRGPSAWSRLVNLTSRLSEIPERIGLWPPKRPPSQG